MVAKKKQVRKRGKQPEYWFAARRYCWGRPLTWHGRLIYAGFAATIVGFFWLILQNANDGQLTTQDNSLIVGGFFVTLAVVVPVLTMICLFKGEPLSRRGTKRKK